MIHFLANNYVKLLVYFDFLTAISTLWIGHHILDIVEKLKLIHVSSKAFKLNFKN